MRVVVYKENKNFQREREYHINLSTLMNLQDMYILSKQIHVHKLQLKKKKKKKHGIQKRFYGKTIGEYIYIYKF